MMWDTKNGLIFVLEENFEAIIFDSRSKNQRSACRFFIKIDSIQIFFHRCFMWTLWNFCMKLVFWKLRHNYDCCERLNIMILLTKLRQCRLSMFSFNKSMLKISIISFPFIFFYGKVSIVFYISKKITIFYFKSYFTW